MSAIRILRTAECEPGMILAADIANDFGAIVLYKNSILDEYSINRLANMGISLVKVFREYAVKEKKADVMEARYSHTVSEVKDIMWDIHCGKTIDTAKVQEITRSLSNSFDSINDAVNCLNKVRSIDEYTYSHSINVAILCSLLGPWLNMDPVQTKLLTYCGLLHDIGKSKIAPDILNKPDALSPKEFEEIKKHPVLGYKTLEKTIAMSKEVAAGVLMHHEREDGSGYPLGLKSPQIHPFAKIIGVVDIYDAMTSNRCYKRRQPPFAVLELYESEYLTKCDANIMLTFLKHISSYYIGSMIKLNNGQSGEIIYINPHRVSKPLVKLDNGEVVDLSLCKELKIIEML